MAEAEPAQEEVTAEDWEASLDPPEIRPSLSYLRRLGAIRISEATTESVFHFTFQSGRAGVFIHESRLILAEGPLAALCRKGFTENETKNVTLSSEDDPGTFAIIRAFLYGDIVCLADKSLEKLMRAVRSAHRWQLGALFDVLCRFVVLNDMVKGADDVLTVAEILQFPEVSNEFLDYFWIHLAEHFYTFVARSPGDVEGREVRSREARTQKYPAQIRHCARLAPIWDVALTRGMIVKVLRFIQAKITSDMAAEFIILILDYLEPLIDDDNVLTSLIDLFLPCISRPQEILERQGSPKQLSSRAVTCLLKCMVPVQNVDREVGIEWDWCLMGTVRDEFAFDLYDYMESEDEGVEEVDKASVGSDFNPSIIGTLTRTAGDAALVAVSWSDLAGMPHSGIRVELTVSESLCFCNRRYSHGDERKLRCSFVREVWEDEGETSFEVARALLVDFDDRHAKDHGCPLNFSLRARPIEEESDKN